MSKAVKIHGSCSTKGPRLCDPRQRAAQILDALGERPSLHRALAALDKIDRLGQSSRGTTHNHEEKKRNLYRYSPLSSVKESPPLIQHLQKGYYAHPPWITAFVTNDDDIVNILNMDVQDLVLGTMRSLGLETAYIKLSGGGDSGSGELNDLSWRSHHPDGRPVVELSNTDLQAFPTHPYLAGSAISGNGTLEDSLVELACEVPDIDWVNNDGGGGDVEIHPFDLDYPFVDDVCAYEPEPSEDDEEPDDENVMEDDDEAGLLGEGGENDDPVAAAPIQLEIEMELPTFESLDSQRDPSLSTISRIA